MRYALVTGGSRGIGRAVCINLVSLDLHVIVNFRSNEDEALRTLAMMKQAGGSGEILKFDVSDPLQVENAISNWEKDHPDEFIEVLVNNAGTRKDILMTWMENNDWHNVLNTNLNGFFYVTRAILGKMLARRTGRIINIVSVSGLKGYPGQVNYSASKAGIIGATKALAREVGSRNILVNAVAPGYIDTDMIKDLDEDKLQGLIPLGRFGTPREVADAVCFLASGRSDYISGEVICVDGGVST